jgi:hypothetical protein
MNFERIRHGLCFAASLLPVIFYRADSVIASIAAKDGGGEWDHQFVMACDGEADLRRRLSGGARRLSAGDRLE